MSAQPARAFSERAWTPAMHREHTRAELRELRESVEATMRPRPTLAPAPATAPQPAPAPPGRLLTDIEAAHYLGLSRSAVRALVSRGELPRVSLPACDGTGRRARVLRIDRNDLDKFIDANKG